ncbi:translation initiation factor IF-2-like [Motacilla alba alba]|uniref:translation initiation factor IF-2-like n=1 Tax=Motacilla alba alba TaxID=1094192 RepID=UPI0018D577D8|nr:translation initiation factor IF-2-like [Motacilla alba alba]
MRATPVLRTVQSGPEPSSARGGREEGGSGPRSARPGARCGGAGGDRVTGPGRGVAVPEGTESPARGEVWRCRRGQSHRPGARCGGAGGDRVTGPRRGVAVPEGTESPARGAPRLRSLRGDERLCARGAQPGARGPCWPTKKSNKRALLVMLCEADAQPCLESRTQNSLCKPVFSGTIFF